jgi:hypothetical protein
MLLKKLDKKLIGTKIVFFVSGYLIVKLKKIEGILKVKNKKNN